ncbi:MAG: hypothetical protein ACLGG7_12660 [Bacteriovoracia bacterium]
MPYLFVAIMSLLLTYPAFAKGKITPCAIRNGRSLARELNRLPLNDKHKHCTLTCVVTLECSAGAARSLGLAKEILDLLGLGNADAADLEANERGIQTARSGRARDKRECLEQCGNDYET